ncbi:E3 ISG15--protein ligase HERC5 [Lonchura striata]|uniref:E3 ISG15--protein ligase HERC5 n=1 Tax=Lonchura striata TaxID=40157 RepID=A0A218V359_9PASE|nr:E3 ISG15--protein ligase HERC5 [Lonchura striata domestica]
MALCRGGELFTWGQNTHGQLGVGSQTMLTPELQLVERLKGIPLAQIAAGGAHSTTVSLSGAVYSWGKNSFGQLGLGDMKDRDCPTYVGALEHWKTVFVTCGADHTAILSKEGLVCTFGAGGSGQLGHNSTRNELLPRVVAELWGARVSHIDCGRQYTLVYVRSLDKFYFFGSGDEGQLKDERNPNQLIPLPITSPNLYLNGIATLEDKEVDVWISNSKPFRSIKRNIRLIFSSEACINGSFLDKRDKHFKTSREVSGVDMSEVKHFYGKISKNQIVYQEGNDEDTILSLILLAEAIMKLQPQGLQTLECLWSNLETSFFKKLVILYQRVSQKILLSVVQEIMMIGPSLFNLDPVKTGPLQILQMLYQVNSKTGFRVCERNFHVHEVGGIIDICSRFYTVTVLKRLSKYPCIFEREKKICVHTTECRVLLSKTMHPIVVAVAFPTGIVMLALSCKSR